MPEKSNSTKNSDNFFFLRLSAINFHHAQHFNIIIPANCDIFREKKKNKNGKQDKLSV